MEYTFIIVILLLLVVYIIAIYNSLVGSKLKVKNAWAQIDTQLKRRFDLLPNLIETVKGYAKHEQDTFKTVIEARNIYNNANSVKDKVDAVSQLSDSLNGIFALAENYPELKANENFLELQKQLAETEDKISFSRQFYNDTVQMYNEKILIFPNSIIAKLFGFKESEFFQVDEKEKENVTVSF